MSPTPGNGGGDPWAMNPTMVVWTVIVLVISGIALPLGLVRDLQ
jgi:hypothetical protein